MKKEIKIQKEKPTPKKKNKKVEKPFEIHYRWKNGFSAFSFSIKPFNFSEWKRYSGYKTEKDRDEAYSTIVKTHANNVFYKDKYEFSKVNNDIQNKK